MNSIELKQILDNLQDAINRAIANGGITQYSINSGQSQTLVKQATLTELQNLHKYYSNLYEETLSIETGSNMNIVRDCNGFTRQIY